MISFNYMLIPCQSLKTITGHKRANLHLIDNVHGHKSAQLKSIGQKSTTPMIYTSCDLGGGVILGT